jgi:hypothetical protein
MYTVKWCNPTKHARTHTPPPPTPPPPPPPPPALAPVILSNEINSDVSGKDNYGEIILLIWYKYRFSELCTLYVLCGTRK